MSTSPTVPMIAPSGEIGDVPQERVQDAVTAGFKIGTDLTDPKSGKVGVVPLDRVHDAVKGGMQLKGTAPAKPNVNPEFTSTQALQEEGEAGTTISRMPRTLSAEGATTAGAVMAGGEAIAGGTVGAMALGRAILSPHTIDSVKAIGSWAAKNKLEAYIVYQVLRENIPGLKKALGFVKDAPSTP